MKRILYGLGAVIVVAAIFQLFFRYEYVPQSVATVWRVDRLTGATCRLPCSTKSDVIDPDRTPAPTADDLNQKAIEYEKHATAYQSLDGEGYKWSASVANPYLDFTDKDKHGNVDTVRIVCYCDSKGTGYRWEVNTTAMTSRYINDNADLMKRYGIVDVKAPTPSPKPTSLLDAVVEKGLKNQLKAAPYVAPSYAPYIPVPIRTPRGHILNDWVPVKTATPRPRPTLEPTPDAVIEVNPTQQP